MRLTPAAFIAPSVLAIALAAGAASAQQHAGHAGHTPDQHASHMAMMRATPSQTSQVAIINGQGADIGKATLTQGSTGLLIKVEATGLTPGWHGIHILSLIHI